MGFLYDTVPIAKEDSQHQDAIDCRGVELNEENAFVI